jgi:exonuclease 3'-5' domain-containing protein 1
MSTATTYSIVDSKDTMVSLIDTVDDLPTIQASLCLDLEGVNLCRHGSISLLAIYVQAKRHVYLVDVYKLQSEAFKIENDKGITLEAILQNQQITKVFFDVRNDSDALHHHYGIKLQGIEDVQLMENASRPVFRKRYIRGLEKCIEYDAPMSPTEKMEWKGVKDVGHKMFRPEAGGSYEVFNQRPLSDAILRYCINDVQYLPLLRNLYMNKLDKSWKSKVEVETKNRVTESQQPSYQPQGEDKRYGPWEKPRSGDEFSWY